MQELGIIIIIIITSTTTIPPEGFTAVQNTALSSQKEVLHQEISLKQA